MLPDARQGKNTQHTMVATFRRGVYGRLSGYEDVNDVERLRITPAVRVVDGGADIHARVYDVIAACRKKGARR